MVVALGHVHTQIPARETVRGLLLSAQNSARAEPGCIEYLFAEALDDPGRFVVVQQWRDRAAFDEHYRSPGFLDYQAQIGQYLTRASDLEVYEVGAAVRPTWSGPIGPAAG